MLIDKNVVIIKSLRLRKLFTGENTMAKKQCKICGKDGYKFYPYCYEHLQNTNFKKEFKTIDSPFSKNNIKEVEQRLSILKNEITEEESNNVITINESNKSKCITCGRQTNGVLFCSICYHKYKSKQLLFKITNCTDVELLDETYEGKYTCKDGHIVKSKSERDIDNYLFEHNISHAYEKELPYGAKENDVLHPDFFLPNYLGQNKNVYIEHWGYNENNIQYEQTKKFKLPIYKELGITLICTHEIPDANNMEAALDRKLNKAYIKENQINFEK